MKNKQFITVCNFICIITYVESLMRVGFNIFPILMLLLLFTSIILTNYERKNN